MTELPGNFQSLFCSKLVFVIIETCFQVRLEVMISVREGIPELPFFLALNKLGRTLPCKDCFQKNAKVKKKSQIGVQGGGGTAQIDLDTL